VHYILLTIDRNLGVEDITELAETSKKIKEIYWLLNLDKTQQAHRDWENSRHFERHREVRLPSHHRQVTYERMSSPSRERQYSKRTGFSDENYPRSRSRLRDPDERFYETKRSEDIRHAYNNPVVSSRDTKRPRQDSRLSETLETKLAAQTLHDAQQHIRKLQPVEQTFPNGVIQGKDKTPNSRENHFSTSPISIEDGENFSIMPERGSTTSLASRQPDIRRRDNDKGPIAATRKRSQYRQPSVVSQLHHALGYCLLTLIG
jgi:hypothetical protein